MPPWYSIQNEPDVPSPALLVYPDRIRQNLRRWLDLIGDVQRARPHVKTHKMPRVIQLKRELGITKFKTATIAEAEMTATAGGEDILLAYQPVGPQISRFIRLIVSFPGSRFSAIVDNPHTLREIATEAQRNRVRVPLYVDLDVGMHRTGIAPGDAAFELYRELCDSDGVAPAGLHAYDGHLHFESDAQLQQQFTEAFAAVHALRTRILDAGLPIPNFIASGTPTAALQATASDAEVGSGTIALWDFGQETHSPEMGFQHAAVLLCRVISCPTPDRFCVDLGHKAVASEMPQPRVRIFGFEDAEPVTHSEEHLVLRTDPDRRPNVGTVLYGIPQHICPTVALHQHAYAVQDGIAGERWLITARDRMLTV